MLAIYYTQTGAAESVLQLGALPTPTAGPGEVLIALHASGVNPSDVKARAGLRAGSRGMPYPTIVPHSDGAGVVVAIGKGADAQLMGRRVWLCNGQWQRAYGSAAQYIAIDQSLVFPLPERLSFAEGAALGIPALTAAHSVFSDGSVAGKTLLINGGSGMVGNLAVQLAVGAGAKVIATASDAQAARVYRSGAQNVLNYRSPTLADDILAANDGCAVDRIIEVEFGQNAQTDAQVIKPRGKVVAYGSAQVMNPEMPFYAFMFKGVTLEMMLVYSLSHAERHAAAAHIHRAIEDNTLTLPIHARYPLDECAKAHQVVETHRTGAVIVDVLA